MNKSIDILIINNAPSFYKINLYNDISKNCKIFVIFIGFLDEVVINDSFKDDILFPYVLLNDCKINERSKIISLYKLFRFITYYKYKKIIFGGYGNIEQLFCLITSKKKNCLQFESSIKESKISGVIGLLKRTLFSRFSIILTSGQLQTDVFKALNFNGFVVETKGVGIFDKNQKFNFAKQYKNLTFKFLYVGRLISIKNLEFLIDVFNSNGHFLTVVGSGELEKELKSKAKENIRFTGFIQNKDIHEIYSAHDVFILPSISEPWGLVVEEAIFNGLPVIVSDAVGCQIEMVQKPKTGLVFSLNNYDDLDLAINNLVSDYFYYKNNVLEFDFGYRDKLQVGSYLSIIDK